MKIYRTIRIIITVLAIALFLSVCYARLTRGEVNVHFDHPVMDELNMMYTNTTSPWEFVAYLYGNQDNITRLGLMGYHNAVTNEISLTYGAVEPSEITIHSHPKINHLNGMCFLSNMDRASIEKVVCVMCGIDKIRCYVIN